MLRESQAWAKLEAAWSGPLNVDERGVPWVDLGAGGALNTSDGLCGSVSALRQQGMISETTEAAMRHAIDGARSRRGYRPGYVWPATLEGAVSRAQFCRRMAEFSERLERAAARRGVAA